MILQRLFWKMLPPAEVRVIARCVRDHDTGEAELYGLTAWEVVKTRSLQRLNQSPEISIKAVRDGQQSPKVLANLLLFNVVEEELRSGRNHIYRGALSGLGGGLHYVSGQLIDEAVSLGICSEEDAQGTRERIREEIKSVG